MHYDATLSVLNFISTIFSLAFLVFGIVFAVNLLILIREYTRRIRRLDSCDNCPYRNKVIVVKEEQPK